MRAIFITKFPNLRPTVNTYPNLSKSSHTILLSNFASKLVLSLIPKRTNKKTINPIQVIPNITKGENPNNPKMRIVKIICLQCVYSKSIFFQNFKKYFFQ